MTEQTYTRGEVIAALANVFPKIPHEMLEELPQWTNQAAIKLFCAEDLTSRESMVIRWACKHLSSGKYIP